MATQASRIRIHNAQHTEHYLGQPAGTMEETIISETL